MIRVTQPRNSMSLCKCDSCGSKIKIFEFEFSHSGDKRILLCPDRIGDMITEIITLKHSGGNNHD